MDSDDGTDYLESRNSPSEVLSFRVTSDLTSGPPVCNVRAADSSSLP